MSSATKYPEIIGNVYISPENEKAVTIKFICWAVIMISFVYLVYLLLVGTTNNKRMLCRSSLEGFVLQQEDMDLQHY